MATRDYYEVLGINKDADETTIKKAYRELAMKYHPDRNPGDDKAVERMKEINEAYAVLSDAKKRSEYDAYGLEGIKGYSQEDIFQNVDFSSLFHEFGLRDFFSSRGNIFDGLFGRSSQARSRRRGTDLKYDLDLTLEEVASGTEKTLTITKEDQCPSCHGTGSESGGVVTCGKCRGTGQLIREQRLGYGIFRQVIVCDQCNGKGKLIRNFCKECKGKGTVEKTTDIKVRVPPGADTGNAIRIEGEGETGEAQNGDLYVVLHVQKHPVFERRGDDIYIQKEITFATAALGGKIDIAGLDGGNKLEIPEGTQTGSTFRIHSKGIKHLDGRGQGDEYVMVKVITPKNLNNKEKELLTEFAGLSESNGHRSFFSHIFHWFH
jgi:molecular chaperone DnaJ